jgi:hypothetical protein
MLIAIYSTVILTGELRTRKPARSAACSALPTCSNDTAFCASDMSEHSPGCISSV